MALGSTIYKAELTMADMDRHYYETHELTLAQHPSETALRLMIRLVAFALNANALLSFTRGIAQDDEPDLWQKSYGGDIELWIDLGQPDEKRIRKACGRAEQVVIYTYLEGSARSWWQQNQGKLARFKNLRVIYLQVDESIVSMLQRGMRVQCNVQDAELTLHDDNENSVVVTQSLWK